MGNSGSISQNNSQRASQNNSQQIISDFQTDLQIKGEQIKKEQEKQSFSKKKSLENQAKEWDFEDIDDNSDSGSHFSRENPHNIPWDTPLKKKPNLNQINTMVTKQIHQTYFKILQINQIVQAMSFVSATKENIYSSMQIGNNQYKDFNLTCLNQSSIQNNSTNQTKNAFAKQEEINKLQEINRQVLLNNLNKQPFITSKEQFKNVLEYILNTDKNKFFSTNEEKLHYLFKIIKLLNEEINLEGSQLTKIESQDLIKLVCQIINLMIQLPERYKITDIQWENSEDIYDLSYKMMDCLYQCLKSISVDCLFHFVQNLVDDYAKEEILEGVFKRIHHQVRFSGLENLDRIKDALQFLEVLLQEDSVSEFFFEESRLFSQFRNGQYLEQKTIFGQVLQLNLFPDESQKWEQIFRDFGGGGQGIQFSNSQSGGGQSSCGGSSGYQIKVYREKLNQVSFYFEQLIQNLCKSERGSRKIRFWLEQSIVLNFGKLKTYQNQNEVSSNSYIFNLLRLILNLSKELFMSVAMVYETIESLDYSDLFKGSLFKDFSSVSTSKENFDLSLLSRVKRQQFCSKNNFLFRQETTFVVKVILALLNLSTPCLNQYLKEINNVNKAKNKILYGLFYQDILGRKLAYDVLFEDPCFGNLLLRFLSFESALALFLNGITYNEETGSLNYVYAEDKCSLRYQEIPLCVVEDLTSWFSYLKIVHESTLEKQQTFLGIVFSFLVLFIHFNSWTSNPHLRLRVAEEIQTLSPQTCQFEDFKHNQYSYLFLNNDISNNYLISGLVRRFIEREKILGDSENSQNKYLSIFRFCQIVGFLVSMKEFSDLFTKFALENKEEFLEFARIYLKNLLNNLKDYVKARENYLKLKNQSQENSIDQHVSVYFLSQKQSQQQQLRMMETYLTTYIENMHIITSYSKEVFLMEEIIDDTCQVINAIFWAFENQQNNTVQILPSTLSEQVRSQQQQMNQQQQQQSQHRFNPQNLIFQNCDMYFIASNQSRFLQVLVSDIEYFNCDRIYNCMNRVLTMKERKDRLGELAQKMRNIEIRNQFMDQLTDKAPPEYLDPIMGHFMTNPVKLATSGVVLDRVTILKHMMIDKTDPYNRQPLTYEQLVPQLDLQAKINNYLDIEIKNLQNPKKKKKFSCFG